MSSYFNATKKFNIKTIKKEYETQRRNQMGNLLYANDFGMDALGKLCGLHGKYIDYHLYLTNLFAISAIWFWILFQKV